MSDTEQKFPDHVTPREAGVVTASLDMLAREPCFRNIVRLFASRKAQQQVIDPLKQATMNEVWKFLSRDAGL